MVLALLIVVNQRPLPAKPPSNTAVFYPNFF